MRTGGGGGGITGGPPYEKTVVTRLACMRASCASRLNARCVPRSTEPRPCCPSPTAPRRKRHRRRPIAEQGAAPAHDRAAHRQSCTPHAHYTAHLKHPSHTTMSAPSPPKSPPPHRGTVTPGYRRPRRRQLRTRFVPPALRRAPRGAGATRGGRHAGRAPRGAGNRRQPGGGRAPGRTRRAPGSGIGRCRGRGGGRGTPRGGRPVAAALATAVCRQGGQAPAPDAGRDCGSPENRGRSSVRGWHDCGRPQTHAGGGGAAARRLVAAHRRHGRGRARRKGRADGATPLLPLSAARGQRRVRVDPAARCGGAADTRPASRHALPVGATGGGRTPPPHRVGSGIPRSSLGTLAPWLSATA